MNKNKNLKVSIVMGSQSDYKIMRLCVKTLKNLGAVVETKIISAHRTLKGCMNMQQKLKKTM